MTTLYTILILLISLVALFLLIAALTKKDFMLEKKILIHKPQEEVFNYLRQLKNQENYSVWVMKDPNIKIQYGGIDGTVGATSAWQSEDKNVGIGDQEIIRVHAPASFEVIIRFKKPFEGTNHALTTVTALTADQSQVTTQFKGTSKFPMNIMNLFMDRLIGQDMQKNLERVKTNLESKS